MIKKRDNKRKSNNMKMFKKRIVVNYRDVLDPNNPFRIIERRPVYKMVWDMKKIGIFGGVFATVIALLFTTAMFAFRGGNSVIAASNTTVAPTTTIVEQTTTTTTTIPSFMVPQYVCDMPMSYSTEYDMNNFISAEFNAQDWKDRDITLVFEWVLPDEYDQYMPQFAEYVDKFSIYTGIKTQVIKGYDETASDSWDYEWNYVRSQEKVDAGEDSSGFYQERVDAFLAKYDTKKIGVNVVLDDSDREDGAVGWMRTNNLQFGITLRAFEVNVVLNGKGYTYWERSYGGLVLHELGHAIGLDHTHVANDGIYQEDSIMSYETSDTVDYYLPGDIAAMQKMFCTKEGL